MVNLCKKHKGIVPMKKLKILLITSLFINLVLIGTGGYVVYKKGGVSYVSKKISAATSANTEFSPYYYERTSVYDNLETGQVDIAFIGDSLTERGEWSEFFPGNTIINRGISGDSTKGLLNRIDQMKSAEPQKIFVMIGINDIYEKYDTKITERNYEKILDELQKQHPKSQIFVQSVLYVNTEILGGEIENKDIDSLNIKIKELATSKKMTYVDLTDKFATNGQLDKKYTVDGLHLNGNGYNVWKKEIENLVE